MIPSEIIKDCYFKTRGKRADDPDIMFACILDYLDEQADRKDYPIITTEKLLEQSDLISRTTVLEMIKKEMKKENKLTNESMARIIALSDLTTNIKSL